MRTFILAFLLAVGLTTPGTGSTSSLPGAASAVQIETTSGKCTGTMVGTRTLLTATHCFGKGDRLVKIDGIEVVAVKRRDDGNDHTLIWLWKSPGKPVAPLVPSMPVAGTRVHIWGNPGFLSAQLRIGHVSGYVYVPTQIPLGSVTIDMNTWHGDSGSGIMDAQGRVRGVLTGYVGMRHPINGFNFRLTYVTPFAFDKETLAEIA